MKKKDKKGFTLVEMLVVIAVIAVLVAIIVPTTINVTHKAQAATDAANLRSYQSELLLWKLAGGEEPEAPVSKIFGTGASFTYDEESGKISVYFEKDSKKYDVEYFAGEAGETVPAETK